MMRLPTRPKHLNADDIERLRVLYETTPQPLSTLAKNFRISIEMLARIIAEHGWRRAVGGRELIGVSHERAIPSDTQSTIADLRAAVLRRHREEWQDHAQMFGIGADNIEVARHGKTAAEMLLLRQRGERDAWGITEEPRDIGPIRIKWIDDEPKSS